MADRGSKEKGPVEHGDVDRGGDDHGSEASFRSRADGEEYDSESDGAAGLVRRRRHGEASGSEDEDDREDRDERESIEEGAGRPPLYSDEEDDVDIDDDGIGEVGASEFDDEVILVDMAARSKRQDEERLMLLEDDDDGEEEDGRGDTGGEADLLVDGQEGGVGLRRQVPEGDEGGVAEEDDSADNDEEVLRREGQLKNTVGAVETEGLQDKASKKDVEPFVVPTSGAFYMHDDRFHENGGGRPRRNLGGRKLWEAKDDSPWVHDKFEELNLQDEEFNRSRSGRGSRGHRGQARGGFGVRTAAFRGGNAGRGRVRGRGRGQGQGGQWNTEGKLTEVSSASGYGLLTY
ncbi:hypothetical protein CBR_g19411 [Chara braunii]|uniref:Btz domain-containing protein n=1 Tax=Chara braunii TaxID=69332 RepID=A0A388KY05_CHABU|nr:hypothetical protein CBR_g19411 [Chara braunii]|eukprot:GBG74898.1 hypothetical protein CBR_g19411 [Chara braunii]